MRVRKKFAWLLSFLLIFSVIAGSISVETKAQGVGTTFTVNITNNTSFGNGNLVWYRFDNAAGWTQATSGTAIDISGQSGIDVRVERADANEVALDFTGSTGFATDDFMGTTGDSGQRFTLEDGQSYILNVTFNPSSGGTNPETIAVAVSQGEELLDSFGSNLKVDGILASGGFVTVEQASTHTIGVCCAFGSSIGKVVVNGTEVTATPDEFGAWYYFEVADATSYDIKLSAGSSSVYTIAWDNEGTLGTDAVVAHGKVEIVPAEGITDMTEDHTKGGHYAVNPGTMVTIKLVPDYGYQLKSTDLNGATVAAGSEVSTFTFEMPSTNLHLAALFEKTADQVDCTASNVVNNVSIGNGGNAVSSGNLKMTVADNGAYTTDVSTAVSGSSVTKVASVDLTLDNIVSKGNNDYWTSNVTEFTNPISVGLQLDSTALSAGETYSVVRDHNGTLTELDATYDSATGTLTFATNQFSTYTIVKKVASAGNSGSNIVVSSGGNTSVSNVYPGGLTESTSQLTGKVLTADEQARVAKGESVNVYLEVKDVSGSVTDAEKALIEGKRGNAVIGMYLDFSLFKQIGGGTPQAVSDTNGKVAISYTVPDTLINKDSSIVRTYKMIRIHNGKVDVLDCKFDAPSGKITFYSDAFSTYALVYTDAPKGEAQMVSPKTGENDTAGIWLMLAVISAAGAVYFVKSKKIA